jgi:hypothetical protein
MPQPTSRNRRKRDRFLLRGDVQVVLETVNAVAVTQPVHCVNVSETGICIETNRSACVNDLCTLILGYDGRFLRLAATVVRCTPAGVMYRIGVEFMEPLRVRELLTGSGKKSA